VSPPVVTARDGAKALLACSVPLQKQQSAWASKILKVYFTPDWEALIRPNTYNLKFDDLAIQLHCPNFLEKWKKRKRFKNSKAFLWQGEIERNGKIEGKGVGWAGQVGWLLCRARILTKSTPMVEI
jgi:hypothetical protein